MRIVRQPPRQYPALDIDWLFPAIASLEMDANAEAKMFDWLPA